MAEEPIWLCSKGSSTSFNLDEVEYRISSLKLLGCKGTTGTQASFLELFEGDHEKCRELDRRIAREMGFQATVPVSGQTYSRKVDAAILSTLSGIAAPPGCASL